MKLFDYKSTLKPPLHAVVYTTDRSKAVVPALLLHCSILVYSTRRFRKIVGKSNFSEQFRKLINRYKRIGYSLDITYAADCMPSCQPNHC